MVQYGTTQRYCQHTFSDQCAREDKVTSFIVHKPDGMKHVFTPSKKELFFSDNKGDTAHVLVNTVYKNKSKNIQFDYKLMHLNPG